jgi:hypothetical protein
MALTAGLAKVMGWKLDHPNGLDDTPWVMPVEYRKVPTLADVIKHGFEFSRKIERDLKKLKRKK